MRQQIFGGDLDVILKVISKTSSFFARIQYVYTKNRRSFMLKTDLVTYFNHEGYFMVKVSFQFVNLIFDS